MNPATASPRRSNQSWARPTSWRSQEEVSAPPVDRRAAARGPHPVGQPGADQRPRASPSPSPRRPTRAASGVPRILRRRPERTGLPRRARVTSEGIGMQSGVEQHQEEHCHASVAGDQPDDRVGEARRAGDPSLVVSADTPGAYQPRDGILAVRVEAVVRSGPGGGPDCRVPVKRNGEGMTKTLVVVESPAKAKTIERYLGSDYMVRASYGHVRDLPKRKLGRRPDAGLRRPSTWCPRTEAPRRGAARGA